MWDYLLQELDTVECCSMNILELDMCNSVLQKISLFIVMLRKLILNMQTIHLVGLFLASGALNYCDIFVVEALLGFYSRSIIYSFSIYHSIFFYFVVHKNHCLVLITSAPFWDSPLNSYKLLIYSLLKTDAREFNPFNYFEPYVGRSDTRID